MFTIYTRENLQAIREQDSLLHYDHGPRANLESALAILQQAHILSEVAGVTMENALTAIQLVNAVHKKRIVITTTEES